MHDTNLLEDQPIAWTPTPDVIERSQLKRFMNQVGVETWDELYQFSIRDVERFTEEVLKFLDIKFNPPYEKLLDTSNGPEVPVWLGGTRTPSSASGRADEGVRVPTAGLNITEMCLDRWQTDKTKVQPAVIWEGEDGLVETHTYNDMYDDVMKCAAGLRAHGLGKSDAIGIHLPMIPETVVALLAIGRIGAIAVPVFSGYGIEAIVSRMNAVGAKALFTSPGFERRGKHIHSAGLQAAGKCRTVEVVFAIRSKKELRKRLTREQRMDKLRQKSAEYNALSKEGKAEYQRNREVEKQRQQEEFYKAMNFSKEKIAEFEQQIQLGIKKSDASVSFGIYDIKTTPIEYPFKIVWWDDPISLDSIKGSQATSAEDPLIILYTSGTTGKPKGIAHTHASFPIKAAQDMAFGTDVGRGTRICWYTDIGWMMGPWLIYGALINGATICIYDGAPDYPTPDRMWEFCAKHKVEVLGISPTLVRALAAHENGRNADASVLPSENSAPPATTKANRKKGWHSRGYLPHFDGDAAQFVTFRLADSLPQSVLRQIEHEIEMEKPADASRTLRIKVDKYLDSGTGECLLRQPEAAAIVQETILNEDGKTCRVDAWAIMPNHVHILLRPNEGVSLSTIMKSIKSVSSHKINRLLGRSGAVWQPDYFDRFIRDSDHYAKTVRYIENNPVKAGLCSEPSEWPFSSAGTRTPGEGTRTPSSARVEGSSLADEGVRVPPYQRHDLSSLRAFASTGEPWNPAPWWWLFEKVGNSKLPIINYSGGTEISGGILMGNPLLPQKPCSFPAPCPGMDVDILNEEGQPAGPNEVGELVIKQPWIGMARGFWQDRERYFETYWSRFPGIWVHGDWAMRDNDGHWFILGRSDDTLKVAGKRVGPAEVESLLVAHPLVTEAAVIGVPDEVKGTAMVAFVVLRNADAIRIADAPVPNDGRLGPHEPSTSAQPENTKSPSPEEPPIADEGVRVPLDAELKALVGKDMGKPLAPSRIYFVSALPKTRNAKVMRRVIRAAYLGEDPGDLSALENPNAVEEIAAAGK